MFPNIKMHLIQWLWFILPFNKDPHIWSLGHFFWPFFYPYHWPWPKVIHHLVFSCPLFYNVCFVINFKSFWSSYTYDPQKSLNMYILFKVLMKSFFIHEQIYSLSSHFWQSETSKITLLRSGYWLFLHVSLPWMLFFRDLRVNWYSY